MFFFSIVGLERVDDNAFYPLKNLIELDLSSNSLNYIPSQSFSELKLLRYLDLSSNQISSVPNHSFANLSNLRSLYLARYHSFTHFNIETKFNFKFIDYFI